MIIDNRYYRIKSIFGYRLRALLLRLISAGDVLLGHGIDNDLRGLHLEHRQVTNTFFIEYHPIPGNSPNFWKIHPIGGNSPKFWKLTQFPIYGDSPNLWKFTQWYKNLPNLWTGCWHHQSLPTSWQVLRGERSKVLQVEGFGEGATEPGNPEAGSRPCCKGGCSGCPWLDENEIALDESLKYKVFCWLYKIQSGVYINWIPTLMGNQSESWYEWIIVSSSPTILYPLISNSNNTHYWLTS